MLRTRPHLHRFTIKALSFGLFWAIALESVAQEPTRPVENAAKVKPSSPAPSKLSLEQELAVSLLRSVADELKSESDKPASALLQAQAADTLWQYDELGARTLFRIAFDAARAEPAETSATDNEAKTKQAAVARRRAYVLNQIILMLGEHDRETSERWLASLNEVKSNKDTPAKNSQQNAEFLAQLGLQIARTKPDEAQKLGLLSLNAAEIPSAFGRLLIALRNIDLQKSDVLFKAAIAAMRRNGLPSGSTLSVLSNYLFFNDGALFGNTDASTARLFVDYILDAAEIQVRLARDARASKAPLPESAVRFTNFLAVRGLAMVGRQAADKLTLTQSIFTELSAALSQQQAEDMALMTAGFRQEAAMDARNEGGLEAQIERAEHEKDVAVRDNLWRHLAIRMRFDDPQRALSLAARIDDKSIRELTQDDINLVFAGEALRSGDYDYARKVALKFNETNLRAKTLAEVADLVWKRTKNREQASELLSEAYETVRKGEQSADRAAITLLLAQKFATFDSERSFGLLEEAIKTMNQIQTAGPPTNQPAFGPGPRVRVISISVVGGAEMTTGLHATLDSLNFTGLAGLFKTDYFRSRNMGDNLQNKIVRGRYLVNLAQSVLNPKLPVKDSFQLPAPLQ